MSERTVSQRKVSTKQTHDTGVTITHVVAMCVCMRDSRRRSARVDMCLTVSSLHYVLVRMYVTKTEWIIITLVSYSTLYDETKVIVFSSVADGRA